MEASESPDVEATEASESPDVEPNSYDNSLQVGPTSDLTESDWDLFWRLKLIEEEEWTESDEDMIFLCGASGSSTKAQSSSVGLCDPMAAYLSEEFKAFLEKRGTHKELERVVSGLLLKLLQAKRADGNTLFVVKPNSTRDENMSDKQTSVSASIVGQVGVPPENDISPSLTVRSLIDVLDRGPSTTETTSKTASETTTGTCDIPEREWSFHLQIGQQETPCSQESPQASLSECLIPDDVKTGLRPDFDNRRRLSQIPPRSTGRLPAPSDARGVSDSSVTLHRILRAALSSLKRRVRREVALCQKCSKIGPLHGSR